MNREALDVVLAVADAYAARWHAAGDCPGRRVPAGERALRGNDPTFVSTTRFTSLLIVDLDEVKEVHSYAWKDCTATRGVITKAYLCVSAANQDEST